VAKLIVHGKTRQEALARLDAALAQTHIVGLQTNVQFLRYVLQSKSFAEANLDTALIPREEAVLFNQERIGLPMAVACAVAHTLTQEKALETSDPFSRRDGWQSHGVTLRRFEFEFHGVIEKAELTYLHDGALHLAVGDSVGVLTYARTGNAVKVRFARDEIIANVYINDAVANVFCARAATKIVAIDLLAHAGVAQAEGGRLTAPMPGKVVSFAVKAGDKVSKGQALAVMEAMKMEHTIAAPLDGVVQELLYAPGDQVAEGAELLKLGV
jgi:3-methylcrotonyl-CoA carboxylase alpha subunit